MGLYRTDNVIVCISVDSAAYCETPTNNSRAFELWSETRHTLRYRNIQPYCSGRSFEP